MENDRSDGDWLMSVFDMMEIIRSSPSRKRQDLATHVLSHVQAVAASHANRRPPRAENAQVAEPVGWVKPEHPAAVEPLFVRERSQSWMVEVFSVPVFATPQPIPHVQEVTSRHVEISHDGFSGDVIGRYVTREGKRGIVVQQDGTKVVHVYGEKWIVPVAAVAVTVPHVPEVTDEMVERACKAVRMRGWSIGSEVSPVAMRQALTAALNIHDAGDRG